MSLFPFYILSINLDHDETKIDLIKDFTAFLVLLEIDNLQTVASFDIDTLKFLKEEKVSYQQVRTPIWKKLRWAPTSMFKTGLA